MYYFAMDLGWKRVPMLLILLIFWKHAFGQKGWSSHDVPPHQKWHDHKIASPRGAQSSVFEAPVTGSIPFEEVASNVLAGKSLNPSRSRFSLSRQYVKGGISGSSASMSHTQSAPSSSVSASLVLPQNLHSLYSNTSLLQLQGSFSPSVQDIASQSGVQLGETSSPLSAQSSSSTGSSASSLSEFTDTSQGSSGPQLAGSSSQLLSTDGVSGLLPQSQSTASQIYTKLAASPPSVSQSTSGQSSYSQYTSGSQRRVGTKLVASRQYVPTLESSYGSSFQPQGTTSQYAPTFSLGAKVPVPSQYYPATLSGSSQSISQSSQKWQPSTARTNVFQPSSTAVFQGFQTSGVSQSISQYPSRFVSLSSASADGASLQLQGTSSQFDPASLDAKVPVYRQAAPSGFSLSTSQPSQLKPSTLRLSQGFQASGTVASQSNSPFQGSKSPSRFSTLKTAASPGQSFSNVYTSSSLSRAGAQLAGSSLYVPMQTGSTSTDGSSLHLQGTSSQYAPASLVAKVPPYKPAAPSGSSSLSQLSQWQPSTSRWSQGFQVSGTVASQSGSKSPSRFSTLTSPASPGKLFSTQDGSGRYSGLFSQSQSASSQYAPAALDAKVPVYSQADPSGFSLSTSQTSQLKPSTSRWSQGFQASGTVASQSGSLSQGSKSPSRFSTLTSATSPGNFFSTQDGSGRYSSLSSQSQSASSRYNPGSPAYAKRSFSLLDSSRQSTSDQSSSPQFSTGSFFMAALNPHVDSVSQSSRSSISNSWRTSSLSGVGLRPSMLSSKAASGSIRRQMSPGLFGSVQHPTDSSTYGQKPSQSSSTSGRYFSSVKG
ncbi:uncharacterized protein zgc:111868 [Rhinichthys klamathensis goyatoka]|uniref:uncharacterized protein zgc:111868 n=1 Tax=Rhinichthys klamathensis goyatoka TaxID=3034132 RepID=UPI0024B62A53|nr:uncharacterized protein zgc:111868 [Rhinichthys klamathensis goyatoka]